MRCKGATTAWQPELVQAGLTLSSLRVATFSVCGQLGKAGSGQGCNYDTLWGRSEQHHQLRTSVPVRVC